MTTEKYLEKILEKYKHLPGFQTLGDGCGCCARYIAALELARDTMLEKETEIAILKEENDQLNQHIDARNQLWREEVQKYKEEITRIESELKEILECIGGWGTKHSSVIDELKRLKKNDQEIKA